MHKKRYCVILKLPAKPPEWPNLRYISMHRLHSYGQISLLPSLEASGLKAKINGSSSTSANVHFIRKKEKKYTYLKVIVFFNSAKIP